MDKTDKMDTLSEWFAGDAEAQDLYNRIVFVAHAWDDLVDKDKPVSEDRINTLMLNALMHIPMNLFYRKYEAEIRSAMFCGMLSYMAANTMERSEDDHKVEIAHYLRYAIVQAVVFMIGVINGVDRAPGIIAEAMTTMIPERLADYSKEHLGGDL